MTEKKTYLVDVASGATGGSRRWWEPQVVGAADGEERWWELQRRENNNEGFCLMISNEKIGSSE